MNIAELKERHPRRFAKLFEEWSEHEPWGEWYESVLEFAEEDGAERGFMIESTSTHVKGHVYKKYSVYWSGFWSQGDGASWEGHVDIPKWIAWMRAEREREMNAGPCRPGNGTPFTDEQMLWIDEGYRIDWLEARMYISASIAHYSHSGKMECTTDSVWFDTYSSEVEDGVFAGMNADKFVEAFNGIVGEKLFEYALDAAREFADEIYHNLEQEYEHLTSEEQFMESVADEEYEDEEA